MPLPFYYGGKEAVTPYLILMNLPLRVTPAWNTA